MRIPSSLGLTAELLCLTQLWLLLTTLLPTAQGVDFTPVPLPDLDLDNLGRVALAGDFDAVSLYTYQQQTENGFSTNGTQSVIAQLPNGDFADAANADGYIKTMCSFVTRDGKLQGVIVGGNFTSLGGVQAQGVALYDPSTSKVTPLAGLNGSANALYCDSDTDTVYVGGQFKGLNSTNAIIWVGNAGWSNLPFEGFNGPVNSITKSSNGTIIFAGSFTGLGNKTAPAKADSQVINISSANFTSAESSSLDGFNKESNIVCKSNGQDGAGNTWLLQDNTPGWWRADMNFGYEPSLLRIWNTHYQGRGTKEFRFTAIPINGIMNFTFINPDTGNEEYCDARCPLSNKSSLPYQDFRFKDTVGMNAFRIDISQWYGSGGGLDGVELFQNDTFAYAEGDLNEPSCANTNTPSKSTTAGSWRVMPIASSVSRYLAADIAASDNNSSGTSVVLQPDIKQQGNYTVLLYTPGCVQDSSCDKRGIVNVTGTYAAGADPPSPSQIFQTNNYDKYEEIYSGPVDSSESGFRPSVTITPSANQKKDVVIVAQRVKFEFSGNGTSKLNGLYEFDPKAQTSDSDNANSTVDVAGSNLNEKAIITDVVVLGDVTYVAGNFSDKSAGYANVFSIGKGNATALPSGGLNAQVSDLQAIGDTLYVGGNFTDTLNGSVPGLKNIAAFNTASKSWQALGAGVNGAVDRVVPFKVNVTTNTPEDCISINGQFDQIEASGSDKPIAVPGFAVWVPSRKNWLQNLKLSSQAVAGKLSASTDVPGSTPLLAGSLSAQDMSAADVVDLRSSPLRLNSIDLGIKPKPAGPQTRRRALNTQNVTGIVTGRNLETKGGVNVTVLGGHFTGTASDGSNFDNLAFIDGSGNKGSTTTGLPSGIDADSTFLALATIDTVLYAGGIVTGKVNNADVNGLIVYDLGQKGYVPNQPPALAGNDVVVNAITVPPKKQQVFVGGSFDTAGSLGCPSVCVFDNGAWTQPGSGIGGTVNAFLWQSNNKLLVGGNLTVSNNATSLASYDLSKSQWTTVDGASAGVPGQVTALAQAGSDNSQYWIAGKAANSSAFLVKYDGSKFQSVGDILGPQTIIRGLAMHNLKKSHGKGNSLVSNMMTLVVLGELDLPDFGNASAALFNGTTLTPFILSTSGNSPGSLSQLISTNDVKFKNHGGPMAVGFVVLIALACALGATFLLVVIGILFERYRRKKEGYTPAPTAYFDKTSNMGRIPPEHLFGRLAQSRQPPQL